MSYKNYKVKFYYTTYCVINVKANDEEEAIKKAYTESSGSQLVDNLQECDSPDVELVEPVYATDIRMDNIRRDQAEKIKLLLDAHNTHGCEFENPVVVINGNKAYNIVSVEYIKEYGDGVSLTCEDKTRIYALQCTSDLNPILEAIGMTFENQD